MSNLEALIAKAVASLTPVSLNYTEALPNPASIASECGAQEASDVVKKIDSISEARDHADASGEVNGDELDDYFREMQRYASLLPHLLPKYPEQVLPGLASNSRSTRLFVANALISAPTPQAVPSLESALASESFAHVKRTIQQALMLCQSHAKPARSFFSKILRPRA